MVTFDRLRPDTPRRRHLWLVVGLTLLVVALSVPVGLSVLNGTWGSRSDVPAPASGIITESQRDGSVGAPVLPDAAGGYAPEEQGSAPQAGGAVTSVGTKLARTAWLGIKVGDIARASSRVRAIAEAAGGQVISESIVTAPDPTGSVENRKGPEGVSEEGFLPPVGVNEARLTLRVPADALDKVLTDLSSASLGTLSYRSSQSEDVTETYVDTRARIQPAKDSIARVRALMVKATSLDQIVLLESELARRQADLDSLEQRLAELELRTSTSTVSVTLWTDETAPPEPDDNAFLTSLQKAWDAFLASIMVVVTGLAVLLPWLLLALVVAWFVRRWLRRRNAGAPASSD